MDEIDTLRKFVNQRLTAAAEEILAVFGRTIVQYQEEIDRQRRQLHILNPEIKCEVSEFMHFPACEEEVPSEQEDGSPYLGQEGTEAVEEEECGMTETVNSKVNSTAGYEFIDSDSEFISIDGQGLPHSSSHMSERDAEEDDDDHIKLETPESLSGLSRGEKSAMEPHQLLQSAANQLLSPLSCKVCKLTFADTISLRRHVQNHPRDCGLCGKHLEPTETLKHHFIGHKTCVVCGKICSSISALEMHVRSHVGDKPFRCTVCGRSFVQKGNLKSHMTIHMNDKPFSCPICGKTFRWKVSVQKHMKTHPEEMVRYIGLDGTIEHGFLK